VTEETSPGGSSIFRHEQRAREFEPARGDPRLVEGITDHLARAFGTDDIGVFHELVSDLVHVDVHLVRAGAGRPNVLVTSGMAERPMTTPEGSDVGRWAELMLALPPEWPLSEQAFEDERSYWPIRLLKVLARLPHEYETFLWYGHTIPNGDPPEPYAADTRLSGAILLTPTLLADGLERIPLDDRRVVHLLAVIPIHADEMTFKLDAGAAALAERLGQAGVTEVIDPARASVVERRRGPFRR
jgi:Suppressor of fused protein (SUFU)